MQAEAGRAGTGSRPFEILFEPVADLRARALYAYAATARLCDGGSLAAFLDALTPGERQHFDRRRRIAILRQAPDHPAIAAGAKLILDLIPETLTDPAGTFAALIQEARAFDIAPAQLILQLKGMEHLPDIRAGLIMEQALRFGLLASFGPITGTSAELGSLSRLAPRLATLAPGMAGGLAASWSRRVQFEGLVQRITLLGIRLLATGIDDSEDASRLPGTGVRYASGAAFEEADLRPPAEIAATTAPIEPPPAEAA